MVGLGVVLRVSPRLYRDGSRYCPALAPSGLNRDLTDPRPVMLIRRRDRDPMCSRQIKCRCNELIQPPLIRPAWLTAKYVIELPLLGRTIINQCQWLAPPTDLLMRPDDA